MLSDRESLSAGKVARTVAQYQGIRANLPDTQWYVVAVNTGKIPDLPDLDPPRIVRAVLGLGFPEVSLDVNSDALSNWRYQPQDRIFKRSSASVSTRIFLDREQPDDPDHTRYEGLSAVLSSGMTPFNAF